jgi:hypothetical protein
VQQLLRGYAVKFMTKIKRQNFFKAAIMVLCANWLMSSFYVQANEADHLNPFVGAWDLVKIDQKNEAGLWTPVSLLADAEVAGTILYTASGVMSVQISTSNREPFAASTSFVNGYLAYYGAYEIDHENKLVTHRYRGHINPDMNNETAVRNFRFDGEFMYLITAPDLVYRIVWKRIN